MLIVKVNIKSRIVTVTGPRGTLTKNFKHVDIEILSVSATQLKLQIWFGVRKHNACIQTVATLIENMIIGVTKVWMSQYTRYDFYNLILLYIGLRIQDEVCLCSLSY
jgi:ribosomal protein L6P/L9E